MTTPPAPPAAPAEEQPAGRPRIGRPTKLTPDLMDKIARVVRAGNYLKAAAQFNGVGESTLHGWLSRGRAAAALVDRHDPERRYCPSCGVDREEEAAHADRINAEADERWAAEPHEEGAAGPSYAALNPCPSCGTYAYPEPWELPEAERIYLEFLESVTQAETAAEVAAVTHWRAAFAEDWRAARDFLVRKNPQAWAATTRVQISQDEAERRIDAAAEQVLVAVGVDTALPGVDSLLPGDHDPDTAAFDDDLGWQDGDAP